MTDYDFERAWLNKLSNCLEEIAGDEIREAVMGDSQGLSSASHREEVIQWSQQAMERLDSLVDEETRKAIMTGCACQYPKSDLQTIKATFQETQDLDLVHRMLQNKFEFFLTEELNLDMELIEEVISRGWGLAGLRQGNMIIATKIPKSGYLVEYMNETDPERKRQLYCHCPRVRDALKSSQTIPRTYCYCGAGYYKGIWEEILEKPVQVEVLETVLQGDEVCKIGIHLPPV